MPLIRLLLGVCPIQLDAFLTILQLGRTSLMIASMKGHSDMADRLLAAGAAIEIVDTVRDSRSVHSIVYCDLFDTILIPNAPI